MNKQKIYDIKNGIYNLLLSIKNNKNIFDKTVKNPEILNNNRLEDDSEHIQSLFNDITKTADGGKGSGNFGHKGRPGKRDGSGKGVTKSLSDEQIQNVYDEYLKRIEEGEKFDHNGFKYSLTKPVSKKGKDLLNKIIETGEGVFKTDADVDKAEQEYENALKNGDKKTAEKIKRILRWNMAMEAMYDIACEMYGEEINDIQNDNKQNVDNSNKNETVEAGSSQKINGYDITNDSDLFNEKGEAGLQFTQLNLPQYDIEAKITDKCNLDKNRQRRFNNILEMNKSQFINFCNSETEKYKQYKNNSKKYEKELADENSDLSYFLDYPSIINEDCKNKIFSIAYNNYNISDVIKENNDINFETAILPETELKTYKFDKTQSTFLHTALDDLFTNDDELGNFLEKTGGLYFTSLPNFDENEKSNMIDNLLNDLYKDGIEKLDKGQVLDYRQKHLEKYLVDVNYWARRGLRSFNQFLTEQCLLKAFEGLTKDKAQKRAMKVVDELQDGSYFKGMDYNDININIEKAKGYKTEELTQAQRVLLNSYLVSQLNGKNKLDAINDFSAYGFDMNDIFNNYSNDYYLDKIYKNAADGFSFTDYEFPIRYKILEAFLDNVIEINHLDDLDEKGKYNLGKDIVEAVLNNDTKKLDEFYSKGYINENYKNVSQAPTRIDIKQPELNTIEIPYKYAQLLGNISEISGKSINEINGAYTSSLFNNDREEKRMDLSTFLKELDKVDINNIKSILNVYSNKFITQAVFENNAEEDVKKYLSNISMHAQLDKDSLLNDMLQTALLKQVIDDRVFENYDKLPDKEDKNELKKLQEKMDKYVDNVLNLFSGKNEDLKLVNDVSKHNKIASYTNAPIIETQEIKGDLIKSDTKQLDAFVDVISNINYDDTVVSYKGIDKYAILGFGGEYKPEDFEGLKLSKKEQQTIKNINNRLDYADDARLTKEVSRILKGFDGNKQEIIDNLKDTVKQLASSDMYDYPLAAAAIILKNMKNINDDDLKNKNAKNMLKSIQTQLNFYKPTKTLKITNDITNDLPQDLIDKHGLNDMSTKEAVNKYFNKCVDMYGFDYVKSLAEDAKINNTKIKSPTVAAMYDILLSKDKKDFIIEKDLKENLPSQLKANRIASRYNAIKNKPDVKSNILDTTVIKREKINKDDWGIGKAVGFINKLIPCLNLPKTFFSNLPKGSAIGSDMGKQYIGKSGQEEFENENRMSTSLAAKRHESSNKGDIEPVREKAFSPTKTKYAYNSNDFCRIGIAMTTSGYHYTSAIQEDEGGMGSFIRTVAASAPVYEGEFLRCERKSDFYRNYENIKVGDSVMFNAQHFTYDPKTFGKNAGSMFGEMGFRVKGKMPFLDLTRIVDPDKMQEWEGLVAGCFKVVNISENVEQYGAYFDKLYDLEFDWDKWEDYIHANAKLFANQIGLYDRNGKMKAKDFLNFLIKMRLNG